MIFPSSQNAFTLIELGIVIVIIGLLVGGVLTGKDILNTATVNSAISDITKYNAAATTFRIKYAGLPGDLHVTKARALGFSGVGDTNATGGAGLRDGNGVIEGGSAGSTRLIGESALFWKDLGAAGFAGGFYNGAGTTLTTGANITNATIGNYLPRSKLRDNAVTYVYSLNGRNDLYLSSITTDGTSAVTTGSAVTAFEAKFMDGKIDDGISTTGIVMSMSDLTTVDAGAPAADTVCTTNATPPAYNVSLGATDASNNVVCQIFIRTAF